MAISAVTAAAEALDGAIEAFHTALAAYVDTVGRAQSDWRMSHDYWGKSSLENPIEKVRFVLGQNARTAEVLGLPVMNSKGATLASLHPTD